MPPPAGVERGNRPGEFEIMTRFLRRLPPRPGAYGLKDGRGAVSPPPGCETALTVDAMISGVHFLPADPQIHCEKLLRVNLSDLAAKGAEVRGYLRHGMAAEIEMAWIRCFRGGSPPIRPNSASPLGRRHCAHWAR